jgi:hypothetical protein
MTVGTATAAEASSRGGYAVQVASESNAADAHTVFRTLQTKFPKQLGKREPIVRRTDLGAKGSWSAPLRQWKMRLACAVP